MNLFLIGWSASGLVAADRGERAVATLVEDLPFFDKSLLQTWRAPSGHLVATCVPSPPSRTGDVRYIHAEPDRLALFSGRPITWSKEFDADGRAPLDARFYLREADSWYHELDGRCVAARYDDASSTLELYTDPMGAYHLFAATDGNTEWFSNSPEVLRRIVARRTPDPLVLASLVACGWSLGGRPLWQDVRRMSSGTIHRFRPDGEKHDELFPSPRFDSFFGCGLDVDAAAKTLVEALRALADWPGRPSFVPLTGGRDSRLVFAAALQAEISFDARIIGAKDAGTESLDIQVARLVSDSVGRSLTVALPRSTVTVSEAARILSLTAPGTLSLDLAWAALNRPGGSGVPDADTRELPLPLVHSGHGGEIARTYYGSGEHASPRALTRSIHRQIAHVWPRPPITPEGKQLIDEYISSWVDDHSAAGVSLANLPDLFYLGERMTNWVGASHGFDEHMADLTSPLWTPRLLPYELGLPALERSCELFHFRVLQALAPQLASMPFAGASPPWPTFGRSGEKKTPLRRFAERAGREGRRRLDYRLQRAQSDGRIRALGEAASLARERAPSEAGHSVWQVLNRKGALRLLGRDPAGLDVRSRRTAWRLATVLLTPLE